MKAQTKKLEHKDEPPMTKQDNSDPQRPDRARQSVYTIIDRENSDRSFWLRIGTAFVNRDHSLTVYLQALPVNNRLHIRAES